MTMNPRDMNTKKEIDRNLRKLQISSSRHWTNNQNPRLVRVSRTLGGKDRHSKVCTARGLRDRRIRLSVSTAIQLYDLQDRLGLSQPSKVIDWLLEATKDEIDKLPPLPMLPQFQDPTLLVSNTQHSICNNSLSHVFQSQEQGNQENQSFEGFVAQNLLPLSNNIQPNSFPNMDYNNSPYNFHWDPPNLSLSLFGVNGFSFSDQTGPSIIPQFPSYNMTENIDMRSQVYNHSVTPRTLNLISSPHEIENGSFTGK